MPVFSWSATRCDPLRNLVMLMEHRRFLTLLPECPSTETAFLLCAFLAHPIAIFGLAAIRAGSSLLATCPGLLHFAFTDHAVKHSLLTPIIKGQVACQV